MRIIWPEHAGRVEGEWAPLTGAFGTLEQAESFLDDPPPDLGDPGTVTIAQNADGWFVIYTLEPLREEAA